MTDEAWIEQSLARLETLEAQKDQLEAAGQPVPGELDEEITALYAALESAAADDQAPAAPAPAAAPAPQMSDPFGPAGGPTMAPAAPEPVMAPAMDDFDDEFKGNGKGGLFAVMAVVLLAAGGGGYWYMSQQNKPAPKPEAAGPAKVISASSVPEDTQEPQAAKGGSADKTPGTEIPEGGAAPKRGGHGGGHGGKRRPRNNQKNDGRKVKLDDSRDPLAGI